MLQRLKCLPCSSRSRFWQAFTLGLVVGGLSAVMAMEAMRIQTLRIRLQSAADVYAIHQARHLGQRCQAESLAKGQSGTASAFTRVAARKELVQVTAGIWDQTTRRFHATEDCGNAVRVIVSENAHSSGFFGGIVGSDMGEMPHTSTAESVAAVVARDIVFLVDLSGAMNDATEPVWAWAHTCPMVSRTDAPPPPVGLQQVFDDFGFGAYPGESEWFGKPWGAGPGVSAYTQLASDGSPLTDAPLPTRYRIRPEDNPLTRKRKIYSLVIDEQIARLMPRAWPTPSSESHYDFWAAYLDYLLVPASERERLGMLPPEQSPDRLDRFCNPDRDWCPHLPHDVLVDSAGFIGYRTYLQFLLDLGRNRWPAKTRDGAWSEFGPGRPLHEEGTAGGVFSFPPREQPMHAVRRSLIAALAGLQRRNALLPDAGLRDRIALIGYDAPQAGGAMIFQPLTTEYRAAMLACQRLQAGSDKTSGEEVEAGLRSALQVARKWTSVDRPASHRDRWIVLIRSDGHAATVPVSRWHEGKDGVGQADGITFSPDTGVPTRPCREETAKLIARLVLEGYRVHTVAVGPNGVVAMHDGSGGTRCTLPARSSHALAQWRFAEVKRELTELLSGLASSARVRLVP